MCFKSPLLVLQVDNVSIQNLFRSLFLLTSCQACTSARTIHAAGRHRQPPRLGQWVKSRPEGVGLLLSMFLIDLIVPSTNKHGVFDGVCVFLSIFHGFIQESVAQSEGCEAYNNLATPCRKRQNMAKSQQTKLLRHRLQIILRTVCKISFLQ